MKYILLIIVTICTSCSSTYWKDRKMDLTDSLHLTTESVGVGLTANISALSLGFYDVDEFIGGAPKRGKYGLGGTQSNDIGSKKILGIGFPIEEEKARSRWDYGGKIPPFTSVGISGGIFVNFGMRFDVLETLDFISGFFMIDFMDDDFKVVYTKSKRAGFQKKELLYWFEKVQFFDDRIELIYDPKKIQNKKPITFTLNTPYQHQHNTVYTLMKCDGNSAVIEYQITKKTKSNQTNIEIGVIELKNK
jgi:hypothetical protein